MSGSIYREENNIYKFNFTNALNSTDGLHNIFHEAGVSILSDVDFIIETQNEIVKNKLISDFKVLSIEEWNSHELYGKFPISLA